MKANKLWKLWRMRVFMLLAVVGPGFITANVDNDANGIYTYSFAGARYGYSLLWTMIPVTVALMVVQEMSSRMGAVTGKGLSDLIREEYGFRTTFFVMLALIITNFGNIVGEYTGSTRVNDVYGLGLVSRVVGGVSSFYDFDGLGSTVGISNPAGSYINRYGYLPFGETTTLTAAISNLFQFAGKLGVTTGGNGLTQMRLRNYSTTTGQFVSDDPKGLAAGYPAPDGKLVFDKLSSVYLSGNKTRDDAPNHIRVERRVAREVGESWVAMCPAHVYELAGENGDGTVTVELTPSNCVQCGAITAKGGRLTPPEGGSGPEYKLV